MTYESVLPLLNSPIRSGNGVKAYCPAHDDSERSLAVEKDANGIANTIVCGNMGRERNLVKDKPCKKNRWGIRRLTEREYARLQGFPDSFEIPVSMTQAYKQLGNAVTVPVVKSLAREVLKTLSRY